MSHICCYVVVILSQHFWPSRLSSSSWFLTPSYGHSSTQCGMCLTLVSVYCIRCCRTLQQTKQLHRAFIRRTTLISCSTSFLLSLTVRILQVRQLHECSWFASYDVKNESEHLYSALHGTNHLKALRHGSHSF